MRSQKWYFFLFWGICVVANNTVTCAHSNELDNQWIPPPENNSYYDRPIEPQYPLATRNEDLPPVAAVIALSNDIEPEAFVHEAQANSGSIGKKIHYLLIPTMLAVSFAHESTTVTPGLRAVRNVLLYSYLAYGAYYFAFVFSVDVMARFTSFYLDNVLAWQYVQELNVYMATHPYTTNNDLGKYFCRATHYESVGDKIREWVEAETLYNPTLVMDAVWPSFGDTLSDIARSEEVEQDTFRSMASIGHISFHGEPLADLFNVLKALPYFPISVTSRFSREMPIMPWMVLGGQLLEQKVIQRVNGDQHLSETWGAYLCDSGTSDSGTSSEPYEIGRNESRRNEYCTKTVAIFDYPVVTGYLSYVAIAKLVRSFLPTVARLTAGTGNTLLVYLRSKKIKVH